MTFDPDPLIARLSQAAGLPVAISAHPGVRHLCRMLVHEIALECLQTVGEVGSNISRLNPSRLEVAADQLRARFKL